MSAKFDLVITVEDTSQVVELVLQDEHGSHLAYRQTEMNAISASRQRGLFDLRNYLRLFVEKGTETGTVAEVSVCIANELLGAEIFGKLAKGKHQRTLRIHLPRVSGTDSFLAAALARVPWEMARADAQAESLSERNLLVRVVHDMREPPSQPLTLLPDEPLRVLFVLAEARGSRPLGARQERRELLQMFSQQIYPRRRVVAHFLTHGVTRERLVDQIQQHNGYHIVHWSGHGHLNRLELARPGGAKDPLTGEELLTLFDEAGGFLPRLVFLSACQSGDALQIHDWSDFLAIAQGQEPALRNADVREFALEDQPGFTGTAHALLQGGVPSVLAMRYAVSDDYARELAVEFYRALLAHDQPKHTAAALSLARNTLLGRWQSDPHRFSVCDHATPVLYGAEQSGLAVAKGPSPEAHPRSPHLHRIAELTLAGHEHFVGRTWELASLGADFIGSSGGDEIKPVAVVTGLGGMGKTALIAEAIELWATRFDWVLLYQAKPGPLGLEATLRDIHLRLLGELGRYEAHLKERPADAVYRDADASFSGPDRIARLIRNLARALRDEAILLVLDNFETNLRPQPAANTGGQPVWACQDPAWDECLKLLAGDLAGSRSRVLITSRWPLAALASANATTIALGPLSSGEAALFLRTHPAMSRMVFGADQAERRLAQRLLGASRFHPLLMDRLARLAAAPDLRPQLLLALDTLESTKGFAQLPALFAGTLDSTRELAYLDDALAVSLDQLIDTASPDARRLLWVIAVANDPVSLELLFLVWEALYDPDHSLRRLARVVGKRASMSVADWAQFERVLTPDLLKAIDDLPPEPEKIDIAPLLCHLLDVGLVTKEFDGPDIDDVELSCHALVRERIDAWMESQPDDRGGLSVKGIRLAYAERLVREFRATQHENKAASLEAGCRALVYCIQTEAWDELRGYASRLITGIHNSRLLETLIPHLQTAVESSPKGAPRRACLLLLADALTLGGQADASLPFYDQAATLARADADGNDHDARRALDDLSAIVGNWASALVNTGNLNAARERLVESVEARKKAGRPQVDIVSAELETLRIDILQGLADEASPEVETRLAQVQQWWQQHRAGQDVPQAPDTEQLARTLISALDVARQTDNARNDWESALKRIDTMIAVERDLHRSDEDIGESRFNRANVLLMLNRLPEARRELEACSKIFEDHPSVRSKVLSSLAELFNKQGDLSQAIVQERRSLALCDRLPDPADRAISHGNLAKYLRRQDTPATLAEADRHRLASLLYWFVIGPGQGLFASLNDYKRLFRQARANGAEPFVPRISVLLADPVFAALAAWLDLRQANVDMLQASVDEVFAKLRESQQND